MSRRTAQAQIVHPPHAWRRVRHCRRFGFRLARYEANGNVAAIEDAKNVVTKAAYNAIGQRTSVNDPNQGAWSFVYNALGEVLSQTDARGIVTAMTYDKLSRPLTRTATIDVTGDNVADTVADSWSYDPANAKGAPLTESRSINGTVEFLRPQRIPGCDETNVLMAINASMAFLQYLRYSKIKHHRIFRMRLALNLSIGILLLGCSAENVDQKIGKLMATNSPTNAEKHSAGDEQEMILFPILNNTDVNALTEEEKMALLGDRSASAKRAQKMSDDMEYWVRIAIENGDYRFSHSYAISLMGDDPMNCYRALYFAKKSVEYASESTKEIMKLMPQYLEKLMEETRFECGCPLEVPGKKLVCRNGTRTFEKAESSSNSGQIGSGSASESS